MTITGLVGSPSPAYRVGQGIAVRYPPGRPGSAVIDPETRKFSLLQAFFLTSGAIAIAAAVSSLATR